MSHQLSVLFVCLGNICRSPSADGVFRAKVEAAGLSDDILVDSAGTAAWHIGKSPDSRSAEHALRRGYDLSMLRARQVTEEDFDQFDYVLAMDAQNLSDLKQLRRSSSKAELGLFLEYGAHAEKEVPDPYYGGAQGFEHVLDLVESACDGLLAKLRSQLEPS